MHSEEFSGSRCKVSYPIELFCFSQSSLKKSTEYIVLTRFGMSGTALANTGAVRLPVKTVAVEAQRET